MRAPASDTSVGIDWASEIHAVCVLDPGGRQVAAFPVAHTADGLARLIAALARLGDPAGIPIAIERPNGRLVDVLLEAGHPVAPPPAPQPSRCSPAAARRPRCPRQ
jgi:Transposase